MLSDGLEKIAFCVKITLEPILFLVVHECCKRSLDTRHQSNGGYIIFTKATEATLFSPKQRWLHYFLVEAQIAAMKT